VESLKQRGVIHAVNRTLCAESISNWVMERPLKSFKCQNLHSRLLRTGYFEISGSIQSQLPMRLTNQKLEIQMGSNSIQFED
jgi:hypothetical protein